MKILPYALLILFLGCSPSAEKTINSYNSKKISSTISTAEYTIISYLYGKNKLVLKISIKNKKICILKDSLKYNWSTSFEFPNLKDNSFLVKNKNLPLIKILEETNKEYNNLSDIKITEIDRESIVKIDLTNYIKDKNIYGNNFTGYISVIIFNCEEFNNLNSRYDFLNSDVYYGRFNF